MGVPHAHHKLISIGDVTIYQVSGDPNGILPANVGDLAIPNDGTANVWKNVGAAAWIPVGGSDTPMAPSLFLGGPALGQFQYLAPGATTDYFLEPAPAGGVLFHQLVLNGRLMGNIAGVANSSGPSDLFVTGIAIDAGPNLLTGGPLPGTLFSALTHSPIFNYPVPAGGIVKVTLLNNDTSTPFPFPYAVQMAACVFPGSVVLPVRGCHGATTPDTPAVFGADASIGITVNAAAGMTPGDTLTIASSILVGVAGARTSGSNDFDTTVATTAALAAEIQAALNDTANSFANGLVNSLAAIVGSTLTLTNMVPPAGNSIPVVKALAVPGDLTLSSPTLIGGTLGVTVIAFPAPTVPIVLDRLFLQMLLGIAGVGAIESGGAFTLEAIKVNGAPISPGSAPTWPTLLPTVTPAGGSILSGASRMLESPQLGIPLAPGDVLTVEISAGGSGTPIFMSAAFSLQ